MARHSPLAYGCRDPGANQEARLSHYYDIHVGSIVKREGPMEPVSSRLFGIAAVASRIAKPIDAVCAARAVQVRPNWRTSLEVLVRCYAELGRWDEAQRCGRQMASVAKQLDDVLTPLRTHNPAWTEQMANSVRRAQV